MAVGNRAGYQLYSLNSIDSTLEEIYSNNSEEISIVERLFSSSLVAVVSLNAPRKLKVSKHVFHVLQHGSQRTILFSLPQINENRPFSLPLTIGLSFQKRYRNMQLLVFKHNTWRKIEPGPASRMPRGKPIHSQYTRHESGAHDS